MKKALHYLLYIIVYGGWYLFSLLPFWVLYRISDFFYFILAYVVRYRHGVIMDNLRRSFPEKDERELRRIEKDFYHYLCDYFILIVKSMTISKQQIMRHFRITGVEKLNECIERGQSCALYLGHLGHYEWLTSLPYWMSPKAIGAEIYHPFENKYFDRLFKRVRERHGTVCITMAESIRKILELTRDGRPLVIGYIADQVPFWNNIHHWLEFFHQDTPVLTGAERIIKKTNQAVFYIDLTRVHRGYYLCDLQFITDKPRETGQWELTDIYFRKLEANIRRDPGIYLWSHNRWKRSHEEYNLRIDPVTGKMDLRPLDEIKREKGLL